MFKTKRIEGLLFRDVILLSQGRISPIFLFDGEKEPGRILTLY